ncbi:MAG: prepilin-type N-terminal cleavage/methylation domain-containing protein [Lysobacterales bacterium]|jgi:prepilin-type N-terminal cleavage/methylation domain-containing protein
MKRIMIMKTFGQQSTQRIRQLGFNLMEVLIGIAIFAIGMLALASLQGNLTRSASDANSRTVATNLAEELIERRRGFARLVDPLNVLPAYTDIATESYTRTIPATTGAVYTVSSVVTDYYFNVKTDSFTHVTTDLDIVPTYSDYKEMAVTVSWASPDFNTQDGGVFTAANLETGSITLSETISSVTTAASSKVVTQNDDGLDPFSITYTPGQRPDIVSLSLGNNRFKESLTPEPDVIRRDELVETRFDVITYSQTGGDSFFVRREEFASVSCDCTLKSASGLAETSGQRPVVWAGDEYRQSYFVDKPYGESDNNQQSFLCDTCCRDHHDGGSHTDDNADTAVQLVAPFLDSSDYHTTGSFAGDHKHYSRRRSGVLSLADSNNAPYVESCRLVRVDGFFKVAQDFQQEDLHVFPADFLDDESEVDTYSAYVTTAADAYENAAYPNYEEAATQICIGGPSPCVADATYGKPFSFSDPPPDLLAGEFPVWTTLPLDGAETQQLRSRGVYIDYLTYDLRTVIDCLRNGGDADTCKSGDVELDLNTSTNVLELIPFFDVQLTFLNRWNESPINNTPVDTTNEGLEDDNTHSRGVASRDAFGSSNAESTGHGGNLAFTDTLPIDFNYAADLTTASINVQSLDASGGGGPTPPPSTDPVVSGEITETVNGLNASSIDVEGQNGALCERTVGGFECQVPPGATNPRVKILGYGANNKDRWACLTGNPLVLQSEVVNGSNAHAIFELHNAVLPNPVGPGYTINIQDSSCPP